MRDYYLNELTFCGGRDDQVINEININLHRE